MPVPSVSRATSSQPKAPALNVQLTTVLHAHPMEVVRFASQDTTDLTVQAYVRHIVISVIRVLATNAPQLISWIAVAYARR